MPAPQLPLELAPALSAPPHDALTAFHPLIQAWFSQRLGEPTEPQVRAWPLIREGKNVLIAAPTGSGKTLTAFLSCLDELVKEAAQGTLKDETRILYVSPLKALGNDIQKNLLEPLEQIQTLARAHGVKLQPISVMVRSGDTPAHTRAQMVKKPPHILITTPESLYLYLTAAKSRGTLLNLRAVVVDEIHALARDKRGSHFSLSMERLRAMLAREVQTVGLSATQKPLDQLAAFLTGVGEGTRQCEVVKVGHVRPWDLTVETPDEELTAVATHEMWGQVYDRLVALSKTHATMLVFANTRKLSERVAHDLGERIGTELVCAHHGSMSRELRLDAETRLKEGRLKIMVATASLELGIDIGSIDLMCQLGTPRSIAVMLQRLGRSGHHKSKVSKGIIFAMTRDELLECSALVRSIAEGTLDAVRIPQKPLDILSQHLVAEIAAREWDEDALYAVVKRAYPYRNLERAEYEQVLKMVSDGVAVGRGRLRVHVHRDRVNGWLKPRKGARLDALQNGGAIADTFTYPVIVEPEEKVVGSLDEDFAIESSPGDVFVLGSSTWRVRRIYDGTMRVEDATGLPPSIPFWLGEAPARTDELSLEVGRLREELLERPDASEWVQQAARLPPHAADFAVAYVKAGVAALGAAPSQTHVIAERFFDEAGGMQLIIHAPFGGRINRAWGMALRKSFCRAFDFELQAAASDDGILLSLGEQHSFPLMDIFDFCHPNTVERVLVQAILQAPMFGTRFRWNASRALTLSRFQSGKRVPPPIQRARAEDLIAAVFPAQVGCQDNHGGMEIDPPDHPLVNETLKDCLSEALDVEGLKVVLQGLRDGRIKKSAVDVPEPSVFAHAMLNSAPYTFLDDAPLEERRARAVSVRRTLPTADAVSFGALDQDAILEVQRDAFPLVRDADELHDALLQLGVVDVARTDGAFAVAELMKPLAAAGRVGTFDVGGRTLVYARERVPVIAGAYPTAQGLLEPLPGDAQVENEAALQHVVRGWMEVLGPTTSAELAARLSLSELSVDSALARIEQVGQVVRGNFRPATMRPAGLESAVEWCDRRLLQRIHRATLGRLRRDVEPLSAQDLMRFFFRWQRVDAISKLRGPLGVAKAVELLQGYDAPAAAWEEELLPSRVHHYQGEYLERACYSGDVAWGRLHLRTPASAGPRRGALVVPARAFPLPKGTVAVEPVAPATPPKKANFVSRNASLTFVRRADMEWLLEAARPESRLADGPPPWPEHLSQAALDVARALEKRGASFFAELTAATKRLPAEVEDALWELLSQGLVTADAVQNLRVLQSPKLRRRQRAMMRGGPGRWTLLRPVGQSAEDELLEKVALLFLKRWGIVFRDIAVKEPLCPPWRELLFVYRRMEARGEVRGGRFVSGFAGEQFALPEAVETARAIRKAPKTGETIRISATDPLNLTGIVTPGVRVPSVMGHEVTFVDGVPQAKAVAEVFASDERDQDSPPN